MLLIIINWLSIHVHRDKHMLFCLKLSHLIIKIYWTGIVGIAAESLDSTSKPPGTSSSSTSLKSMQRLGQTLRNSSIISNSKWDLFWVFLGLVTLFYSRYELWTGTTEWRGLKHMAWWCHIAITTDQNTHLCIVNVTEFKVISASQYTWSAVSGRGTSKGQWSSHDMLQLCSSFILLQSLVPSL